MADVYRVGVAIGITDNASQVIQALGRAFLGLGLKVKDLEGGINRVKIAALGLGGVLAGRAMLEGLNRLAEAGAKLQAAQIGMVSAGMTHREVARETAQAYQSLNSVRGPDIADRVNAIRELRGIVGAGPGGHDFREVNATLGTYLRVRALIVDKSSNDLFRAVELQGGARYNADGTFNEKRFDAYVDAALRTLQAGGGNITARDLLNVMQMASTTARGMDPNTFYNTVMTPILEMGGHRAGTALSAFSRAFFGGIMPERNARELDRLHLYNPGSVRHLPHLTRHERAQLRKQGYTVGQNGFVMVGPGALRGEEELDDPSKGPVQWVNDVLLPRLKADYQSRFASKPGNRETFDAYVRDEMYRALPTETARRIVALLTTQGTSVRRDQTLRAQATGLSAYDIAQQGYTQQLKNLEGSWRSLMDTLGLPAARDGATILSLIGTGIDHLTEIARRHPQAAQDLERLAAGVAVLAAVSGAAAITGTALGPLARGVSLLVKATAGADTLAAVRGMSSLTSALGAFGAAGTAGKALAFLTGSAGIVGLALGIDALARSFTKIPHWIIDGAMGATAGAAIGGLPGAVIGGATGILGGQLYDHWNDKSAPPPRAHWSSDPRRIGQSDPLPLHNQAYVTGDDGMSVHITMPVILDGKVIAEHTEHHFVRGLGPSARQGTSTWDMRSVPTPPGMVTA